MKKIGFFIVPFLLLIGNSSSADAYGGSGLEVTCYHDYTQGSKGKWKLYKCDGCADVNKIISYQNSGKCYL